MGEPLDEDMGRGPQTEAAWLRRMEAGHVQPARRALQEGDPRVDLDRSSAELVRDGEDVLHIMTAPPPVGTVAKGEPFGRGRGKWDQNHKPQARNPNPT